MERIKLFFLKVGLIKLNPAKIRKWARDKNLRLLEYAVNNDDFSCRIQVAKEIINFEYDFSLPILKRLLHDKVFPVVEASILSLHSFSLSQQMKNEIESVINAWEKKRVERKKNWNKPAKFNAGLTIDQSQMKRLARLKSQLAKPKGSMSIG